MMAVIFRLSTDTGEESSSLSGIFTGFLGMSEFLIRKLAHVTEYFIFTLTLFLGLRKGIGTGTKNTLIFMFVIAVRNCTCCANLRNCYEKNRKEGILWTVINNT